MQNRSYCLHSFFQNPVGPFIRGLNHGGEAHLPPCAVATLARVCCAGRSPLDRADAPSSHSTPTRLIEIPTVSCIQITRSWTILVPNLNTVTRQAQDMHVETRAAVYIVNSRLQLGCAYLPSVAIPNKSINLLQVTLDYE